MYCDNLFVIIIINTMYHTRKSQSIFTVHLKIDKNSLNKNNCATNKNAKWKNNICEFLASTKKYLCMLFY